LNDRARRSARFRVIALVASLVVLALASLAYVRGGHFLRVTTRVVLEEQLAKLLAGEVHIDRVAELSLGHIVAEGVTVLDPKRRPVLRAHTLRLNIDLSMLPSGIRFSHGRLRDARIRSVPSDQAGITLFDAFLPRSTGPSDTGGEAFRVWFDDILIERSELVGDLPGMPGVFAKDVTIAAQIHVNEDLEVRVNAVTAEFERPFKVPAKIERGTVTVDTGPFRVTANADASRGEQHVSAKLGFRVNGNENALDLTLYAKPVRFDWVREVGLSLPETLYGDLKGTVDLKGPLDHLTFDVNVLSPGGPISVSGDLPEGGTAHVHLESNSLALPEVLAYAPPVTLSAAVDVEVPPGRPTSVRATAPWVDVMGTVLKDASLQGAYQAGRFRVNAATARYAGGQFSVTGWVDESADFVFDIHSDLPDTQREATLRSAGLSGALDSTLTLSRKGTDLAAKGKLSLRHATLMGASARSFVIEGEAQVFDDDYQKPTLDVRGSAIDLVAPGPIGGALTFSVAGSAGRYRTNLSIKDPRGRSATAKATLVEQADGLRIEVPKMELAIEGREPWRAEADVVFDDDGIGLHKVRLVSGPQRLEMSGRFSYSKAYHVDATLQSFDLGGLRELIAVDLADLDGTVDGKLALTGVPGHPRIDAQGSLQNGQFLGMKGLSVLLSMVFVEGRFDVESELVLPDKSRVAVYAGGEPGRGDTWGEQIASGNYQFGLDFEQLPFEVSRPWLEWLGLEPPKGRISAMVRGAGTFDAPTLELTSRVEGLSFGDWPELDVDVSMVHDGEKLEIQRLRVGDDYGELVSATGSVNATLAELENPEAFRRSLDTRPFTLALHVPTRKLSELPPALRVDQPYHVSGDLDMGQSPDGPTVQLLGTAGFPANAKGLDACGIIRHPEVRFMLSAVGESAHLEAKLHVDGTVMSTLEANAKPHVAAWITGEEAPHPIPTTLTAHVQMDALEEMPLVCDYAAGPLRAEIMADDIFSSPPILRFNVISNGLQLVPQSRKSERLTSLRGARTMGRAFALQASGGVERERLLFEMQVSEPKNGSLALFGSVPRGLFGGQKAEARALEPIELRIRAQHFDLAPVLVSLPGDVRASGRLDGEARVAYQTRDDTVDMDGALDLSEGTVAIAALGQELTDMTASLRLQGKTLRIVDLEARDFDGKLGGDGDLTFESKQRISGGIDFKLREFPVRREGSQVSKLTGPVTVRAELTPERLRADVNLSNIRVDLPGELDTDLQSLDPHPDIVVAGEEKPETDENPYLYEIHVHAKPPFRMRRTDFTADVFADLVVRYRDPSLTILGNAELKRGGSFELYGKRFELEESRMAFDGAEDIDPLVSLYAIHKIAGAEIGVRVEGRLSNPTVTFTHSNPAITDTGEIIAQLLGARHDTTNSDRDATGAAANFLAGATAGLLTQEVRKKFGGALPVFSIEQSGNQAFKSTRIRAGVQLDQFLEKRLGPLRHVVNGVYVEGFVAPGADPDAPVNANTAPQSRGGGLLELRFPHDFVGSVEYRPVQNWRIDAAWEP
jgi:translocation and assembly module TamB